MVEKSITVCLPVFNRGKTIKSALSSISNQLRYPDQVIISNFNSTDNSASIIKEWIMKNEKKINCKYYKYDLAPIDVNDWNISINHVNTDYITILEGDDAWPYNFIDKALKAISNNQNVGLVFFPGTNEKKNMKWEVTGLLSSEVMLKNITRLKIIAAPSQAVFKRLDNYGKLFLYDDINYKYAPEIDLYYRIASNNYKTIILNYPYVYRGIGERKKITPKIYNDHFCFIVNLYKSNKINTYMLFTRTTKLLIINSLRIFKRSIERDKLNSFSDYLPLINKYKQVLLGYAKK
jgi:glycosyltransferase involved in cell wall biosynthesis